ncbi:MAG: type IX secretion system membrane protein PorP/SprF [Bacteroidetes bacterium]|nr:MAG: type IX secretion system membrane protein PorP/SprF [Bacteroidota bacterium]
MKKIFFCLFLFLAFGTEIFAQQSFLLNHASLNKFSYNPAYSSVQPFGMIHSIYRQQWVGVEGAPQTTMLSGFTPLFTTAETGQWHKRNTGIGGMIYRESLGLLSNSIVQISASKFFVLNSAETDPLLQHRFSVGLSLGMALNGLDMSRVTGDKNDPGLANGTNNNAFGTLGLLYQYKDFEFGWAIHDLFRRGASSKLGIDGLGAYINNSIITTSYRFRTKMNGGKIDSVFIEPQLVYRFANTLSGQIEANLKVSYKERYWAVLGYRSSYGLVSMAGMRVTPALGFSVSYDLTSMGNKVSAKNSSGTVEVMLSYWFGQPSKFPHRETREEKRRRLAREKAINDSLLALNEKPDIEDATPADDYNGVKVVKGVIFDLKNVNFNAATATLKDEAYAELDALGEYLLKNRKVAIELGAHTDTLTAQFSVDLTNNRARVVKEYLESRGIESFRLAPVGYGRTRQGNGRRKERVEMTIIDTNAKE